MSDARPVLALEVQRPAAAISVGGVKTSALIRDEYGEIILDEGGEALRDETTSAV